MERSYGDLVGQLEVIVDELDDRSFELLREAAAAGDRRPGDDKRLVQARRAIEKAIRLLRDDDVTDD